MSGTGSTSTARQDLGFPLGNELEAPKPDLTNRRLIVWTPAPARGASGVARAKALLLDGKNATWEHYGSAGHVQDDVGIL